MNIRRYVDTDYSKLMLLYDQSELYGGMRDNNRDSQSKLHHRISLDPDSILVAEDNNEIVGTVSLIEDGRVAFLFRFAVLKLDNEKDIRSSLYNHAAEVLKAKGHDQILVYTPAGNANLDQRYIELDFNKGNEYTCFWRDI